MESIKQIYHKGLKGHQGTQSQVMIFIKCKERKIPMNKLYTKG